MFVFPYFGSINPQAEFAGYDSIFFSLNMGTVFFLALALISSILIYGLLLILKLVIKPITWLKMKIEAYLFWNGMLRFLIESYFEIVIAVGINSVFLDATFKTEMMSFPGVVISTCFCALFLTIIIGLPIFILAFYLSNYEHWNQPKFRSKYGTVLDSMRTTRYRESRKSLHKW